MFGILIQVCLFPIYFFAFVLKCALEYRPMNSREAKISRANKKKWL